MKPSNLTFGLLFATFLLASCGDGANSGANGNDSLTTANTASDCTQHCTDVARVLKTNLSPEESGSLAGAIHATHVGTNAHIHADVVNGRLIFTREDQPDPKHLPLSTAPAIYWNPESPSARVRIVASPAAAQLLDERVVQTRQIADREHKQKEGDTKKNITNRGGGGSHRR